jgi:hypothetical protein
MAAALANGGGYILQMEIQRMLGQAALWHRKAAEAEENEKTARKAGDMAAAEEHAALRDAAEMFANQAEEAVAEGRYANEEEEMARLDQAEAERTEAKRKLKEVEEKAAGSDSDSEDEKDMMRMRSATYVQSVDDLVERKKKELEEKKSSGKKKRGSWLGSKNKLPDEEETVGAVSVSTTSVSSGLKEEDGAGHLDQGDFENKMVSDSGFLVKRPIRDPTGQWKRRFFVLRGSRLAYFKDRSSGVSQGGYEAATPSGVYFLHENSIVIDGVGQWQTTIHTDDEEGGMGKKSPSSPSQGVVLPPPPVFSPGGGIRLPPPSNSPKSGSGIVLPPPSIKNTSPAQGRSKTSMFGFGKGKKQNLGMSDLSMSAPPRSLLAHFESRDTPNGSAGIPDGTPPECCVTIYTRSVALCLVAASESQKKSWAKSFRAAIVSDIFMQQIIRCI